MMARQHANLGVAGFIGCAMLANAYMQTRNTEMLVEPVTLGTLAIVAGGFALMPDLDEPGSTVSRKFGFVSQAFSQVVKVVSFGHRGATHSLLFALLCGFLGVLATGNIWAESIIVVCSAMLITRLVIPFGIGKQLYIPIVGMSMVGAYWVTANSTLPKWGLPLAMASGVVLHILGDSMTPSGVNVLWPMSWKLKIPISGGTGGTFETYVVGPILIGMVLYLVSVAIVIPLSGSLPWA